MMLAYGIVSIGALSDLALRQNRWHI